MSTIKQVLNRASEILAASHPRAHYAQQVISGLQSWSGADLKGKAKRFGAEYARQRQHALAALWVAGGDVRPVGPHGKHVAVVEVGQDDFGNALYSTVKGPARVWRSISRLELV